MNRLRNLIVLITVVSVASKTKIRFKRELFRDKVDPKDGGKIPEANLNRAQFNKLDAMGLDGGKGQSISESLKDTILSDKAGGLTPFGSVSSIRDSPLSSPPYSYSYPQSYQEPSYGGFPETVHKDYTKPKGPVLLEKRPHEVKEIQPVPITVHESYSNFDCRKSPHYDRYYADPETKCTTYHFCHSNGKQDTFQCPYGTIFNEYLGTCDHEGAVSCASEEGYVSPPHSTPYKTQLTSSYAPAHDYYSGESPSSYQADPYSPYGQYGYYGYPYNYAGY